MFAFPDSPAIGESYSPSAGITYQWDGQAWVSAGLLATASIIDRIYLTGTATWTKPAGLAYAEVEGTAAGGSGSGAAATAASTFSGGSGGSAGAWGKKLFAASDLPSSVTITVGAPGTASNGPGVAGANTTFGSLITLPGGPGGTQSANTTASAVVGSWPAASGAPVGVDIGAAGAPGGQSILNTWTSNCQIGGGGLNPYGQAFPTVVTINWTGQLGSGYGVGGSAAANGVSQSARLSGAGAPGFLRVREFYTTSVSGVGGDAPSDGGEYVRVNGVWRLKEQTFDLSGTQLDIAVPTGAKRVRLDGDVWQSAASLSHVALRISTDGSTFAAGASDYQNQGPFHYTGASGSGTFSGVVPTGSNQIILSLQQDATNINHNISLSMPLLRPAGGGTTQCLIHSKSFYNNATYYYRTNWSGDLVAGGGWASAYSIKALRLMWGGAAQNFVSPSNVTVRWSY